MKKASRGRPGAAVASLPHGNGHLAADSPEPTPAGLGLILAGLQTMRDGDFSVRLPVGWTGLEGKIADTFNIIISANEHLAREWNRVGLAVGKEGKTREKIRFQQLRGAWGEME